MSDFRYLLNIDDIRVRVAESLDEDRLSVVLNRSLERALNIRVRESRGYPGRKREGVSEKIVSAAVDCLRRDYMLTAACQSGYRVVYSRRAGRNSESRGAALERGYPALKHILRRVCEASVDVARVLQTEVVGGVLGIMENKGRAGVDRHGARVCGGVGGLLTDVQLTGLKAPVRGISDI